MASSTPEQNRSPEVRRDLLNNRWVIFSPARAKRPYEFKSKSPQNASSNSGSSCPFCIGNEHECAPEIFRVPTDPKSDWKLRVIENLYPALSRAVEDDDPRCKTSCLGYSDRVVRGIGFHDVVIETPVHSVQLSDLDPREVGDVLLAHKKRIEQIKEYEFIKYVQARVLSDGFSLADLFSDDGGWHSDLVRQCFSADEADIILSIPLSISSNGPLPIWKALWQLQLPSKVKVFCWRVCKGILRVKNCKIFDGGSFREMDVWCRAGSFLEEFKAFLRRLPVIVVAKFFDVFFSVEVAEAQGVHGIDSISFIPCGYKTVAHYVARWAVFKNHGASAGASMSHSHSQILALPVIPPTVSTRLCSTKEYFDQTGKCSLCEVQPKDLLIDEAKHFVSIVPFAATFPFEIWIIPRDHSSHFHELDSEKAIDLGGLLKLMLRKLAVQLNNPPFNFMIQTSPLQVTDSQQLLYTHWFLQIVPQLSGVGGFEMGTGCYINLVFPEDAAKFDETNRVQP
ncbi:hypothetical protein EZV62_007587 [Acer yangbiense]|uniref:Uncharacterized protein n=1 Tax=Acer yangbiense TaxID=1000413 RepID=A0A5C7IC11_9ROSI|nr:hypothetical protein EZV62_007587 [Acer yangbiense]